MDELKRKIRELDAGAKYEVFRHLDWLMMQILHSSGLEGPYYIFIDNCILQDAKNKSSNKFRSYRFLATCLFFRFLKDRTDLEIKIAIPASILYEFSGKRIFENENEYLSTVKLLWKCLEPLGFEVFSIGFSDFQGASKSIQAIQFDEKKITKLIKNVKNKEWNVELRKGNTIKFPMAIAYRALPSAIKLKYFNEGYVRWVLASMITAKIVNNRNNDKQVRKDSRHDLTFSLSALNKISKDVIEGLGDLELLSYCDITSQFQSKSEFTCVAITFDENLFKSFLYRQTLVTTHEPFVFGVDSDADRKRKVKQIGDGQKRLDLVGQRERMFSIKAYDFYSEMRCIFI